MNICLDCGRDYEYDSNNPMGSSSLRCPACRKKDSEKNKKIILFNIAGNENIRCRKCGYSRCLNAIVLADTKLYLNPATTQEEKEKRAKTQYLLCLNCSTEIKSGEVEAKIINTKVYPVEVEFYERRVQIVKTKLDSITYSSDVIEAEVTRDEPETSRVVGKAKRITGGCTIDVSDMQD